MQLPKGDKVLANIVEQVKPENLFARFRRLLSNPSAFTNEVKGMVEDVHIAVTDMLLANAVKSGELKTQEKLVKAENKGGKDITAKTIEQIKLDQAKEIANALVDHTFARTYDNVEPIIKEALDKVIAGDTLDNPTLVAELAPFVAFHKKLMERLAQKEGNVELATDYLTNGLPITKDTVFSKDNSIAPKAIVDHFEKQGLKLTFGSLRSKTAQFVFKKFADFFNADFVVVKEGPDWMSGQYIPKEVSGHTRDTIVLNVDTGFGIARTFTHEMFHHIINKAAPEQYRAFMSALDEAHKEDGSNQAMRTALGVAERLWTGEDKSGQREELHAEIFSHAFGKRGFWNALDKTSEGQDLAYKLVVKAMKNITTLKSHLDQAFSSGEHIFELDKLNLENQNVMDSLAKVVFSAYDNRLGEQSIREESTKPPMMISLSDLTKPFNKFFNEVKPKAGEEKILFTINRLWEKGRNSAPGHAIENMSKSISAKIGVASEHLKDAQDIVFSPKGVRARAEVLVKPFIKEISKWSNGQQEMFQNMLRGYTYDDEGNIHKEELKNKAGKVIATNFVRSKDGRPDFKQMEKLLGKTARDFLKVADQISQERFEELKTVFPDLEHKEFHFGQSMKWFRNGFAQDNDHDFVDPTYSKILGGQQFLKKRSDLTMQELMFAEDKDGNKKQVLEAKTMNPIHMLLDYAEDSARTVALNRKTTEQLVSGKAKVLFDPRDAAKAGLVTMNDNSSKIMDTLINRANFVIKDANGKILGEDDGLIQGFQSEEHAQQFIESDKRQGLSIEPIDGSGAKNIAVQRVLQYKMYKELLDKNGKPVLDKYGDPRREDVGTVQSKQAAMEYIAKNNLDGVKIEPVMLASNPQVEIGKIYYHPDFARLMNNYLSKDKIRDNYFGAKAIDLKNEYTTWELGLSLFHVMTIGQELASSFSSYARMAGVTGKIPLFNLKTAWKQSAELGDLYARILENPDIQNDPKTQADIRKLLGNDTDMIDVINQYHNAGGYMKQDSSLVSSTQLQPEMDYDNIHQSFKDAWDKEAKNALEKGESTIIMPALKVARWGALQGTTQWLFESAIPKIKFAQFAREYALKVGQNREGLADGTIKRDELANNTMAFVEDRFGEVNWQNLWMNKTAETATKLTFRSFTWMLGSWKALGKGGSDLVKWGLLNTHNKISGNGTAGLG